MNTIEMIYKNKQNMTEDLHVPPIKQRRRFSLEEAQFLEMEYSNNPSPTQDKIQQIASKINSPRKVVTTWFQNRRAKNRRRSKIQKDIGEYSLEYYTENYASDVTTATYDADVIVATEMNIMTGQEEPNLQIVETDMLESSDAAEHYGIFTNCCSNLNDSLLYGVDNLTNFSSELDSSFLLYSICPCQLGLTNQGGDGVDYSSLCALLYGAHCCSSPLPFVSSNDNYLVQQHYYSIPCSFQCFDTYHKMFSFNHNPIKSGSHITSHVSPHEGNNLNSMRNYQLCVKPTDLLMENCIGFCHCKELLPETNNISNDGLVTSLSTNHSIECSIKNYY